MTKPLRKAAVAVLASLLIVSTPFLSYAEEADVEKTDEEELQSLSSNAIGITEDGDYLMHGSELFGVLKEIRPWNVLDIGENVRLADEQYEKIYEAAGPILDKEIPGGWLMYYWGDLGRYPSDKEIVENALVSKNGIVGRASDAYGYATSDYVLFVGASKAGFELSPSAFAYGGMNSAPEWGELLEGVTFEDYATLTGSPSKVSISALDWVFANKSAEATAVKVPGILMDDVWYDLPVRMYDAMSGEEYTDGSPLSLDIGQYAIVRLEQDAMIGEPLASYVVVANGTPGTAEFSLLNGRDGVGDTVNNPKEEEPVEKDPVEEETVVEEPVVQEEAAEEPEVVEDEPSFAIPPLVFYIGVPVLFTGLIVFVVIFTGVWMPVAALVMEAKYRYSRIRFHGVLTEKKHWAVKTSPHRKGTATVPMILSSGELGGALDEVFSSRESTYLPVSTGLVVSHYGKVLLKSERADEDELYALLEKLALSGVGFADLEIVLVNEKAGLKLCLSRGEGKR